ncbi:hypothetical protein [Mycoplasma sp. HS2188]|uniref:hypothetical protein n=1 Tax=Mycoplasma sp. HS2188 TaxID=2976765 RepID=UPI0021A9E802|nr:hypothetical protein [Mycoplasma sp. HS2188]MCT4469603.1 hypothetical protein [Mycoplasma sp. HS2188]
MNKEEILERFHNIGREFNGYSVPETTAIIDDLVFLLNECEKKINILNNTLMSELIKNQNLENEISSLRFSKKIEGGSSD